MGEVRGVQSAKADKAAGPGRDLPVVSTEDAHDPAEPAAAGSTDHVTPSRVRQVWCAYQEDGSELVLFGRELDGLRYAASHGLRCKALDFGRSVIEQIKGGSE